MCRKGPWIPKSDLIIFICLFLTITNSVGLDPTSKFVNANDIIAKLEAGAPIHYENINVIGELNISKANLPVASDLEKGEAGKRIKGVETATKIINSYININNSTFFGPVNFDGVIFKDHVNFSRTIFRDNASFRYAQFVSESNFSDAYFNKSCFFEWSHFYNMANFDRTSFRKNSNFLETEFRGIVNFNDARFSASPDFRLARFRDLTQFDRSQFSGKAFFEKAEFSENVDMKGVIFSDYTTFMYAKFNRTADLRGVKFLGDVHFAYCRFNDETYFSGTQFGKIADFRGIQYAGLIQFWNARFNGDTYFWNSKFFKYADFSGAQFYQNADLSSSSFGENSKFDDILFNKKVNFYDVEFKSAYFEGNVSINYLNITRAKYDRLYLNWGSIGNLDFNDGAYQSLIKNYNNLGWNKDDINCYYKYRTAAQDQEFRNHQILPFIIDLFYWISYGYGVKSERPVIWSALFIFLFGLIFWSGNGISKIRRTEVLEQNSDKMTVSSIFRKEQLSIEDPFFFSLLTFTSGFTSFIHPTIEYKLEEKYMRLAIYERLLGSILIALFITALSRTYLVR
jgi:hypothetical protein